MNPFCYQCDELRLRICSNVSAHIHTHTDSNHQISGIVRLIERKKENNRTVDNIDTHKNWLYFLSRHYECLKDIFFKSNRMNKHDILFQHSIGDRKIENSQTITSERKSFDFRSTSLII